MTTASLKDTFAHIAISLSHLLAASEKSMFEDQKLAIQAAITQLNDAETGIEAGIAGDVRAAIADQLPAALADALQPLKAQIDDLGARLSAAEGTLNDLTDGLQTLDEAMTAAQVAQGGTSTDTGASAGATGETAASGQDSGASGDSTGSGTTGDTGTQGS